MNIVSLKYKNRGWKWILRQNNDISSCECTFVLKETKTGGMFSPCFYPVQSFCSYFIVQGTTSDPCMCYSSGSMSD